MMVLYSGTTCPYSHRCRFVLFEKGMDFEIRDVDIFAKPEDIALMNPYNEVPILVERDLILYESHIINEYIDERFPHPQLMPGDPVARARVRLFLFNFEKVAHRRTLDIAAVNSAMRLDLEGRRIQRAILSAGGVGPTPRRLSATSDWLAGRRMDTDTMREAARLAVMLPSPKFFERRQNSVYLERRAGTIAARMADAQLP